LFSFFCLYLVELVQKLSHLGVFAAVAGWPRMFFIRFENRIYNFFSEPVRINRRFILVLGQPVLACNKNINFNTFSYWRGRQHWLKILVTRVVYNICVCVLWNYNQKLNWIIFYLFLLTKKVYYITTIFYNAIINSLFNKSKRNIFNVIKNVYNIHCQCFTIYTSTLFMVI
jgi:hypothetical protein